jgi:4-diphosphocytidyl-2-C-methyl-D-erythritol kinase
MNFSLKAPAKINWFLSVIGKRDDGYHDIVSPMQCVSLFDTLSFEDAEEIEIISDIDVPVTDNLVYRAAARLKEYGAYKGGARISLRKEIPAAAGLGGGSSDAASTLMGLKRLWKLPVREEELMEIGSAIGSDVPFFLKGPFSLIEGRGERVSPLRATSPVAMLLVKPDISVSTAWAYSAYTAELTKKCVDIKLFCHTLDRKDFSSLRGMIFNDLEKAAIGKYHVIGEIKRILVENGAVISSMSGSGPTVFGVFGSVAQAREASAKMGDNWCRVVETLT